MTDHLPCAGLHVKGEQGAHLVPSELGGVRDTKVVVGLVVMLWLHLEGCLRLKSLQGRRLPGGSDAWTEILGKGAFFVGISNIKGLRGERVMVNLES